MMSWLKSLLVFLAVLALLALILTELVVGIVFFGNNTEPVTVNFISGNVTLELAWVIFFSFLGGFCIGLIPLVLLIVPSRFRLYRLKQMVSDQQNQLNQLKKTASDNRPI